MSASKEGITLPGEADDKCCFCIPIKPGVMLIGIGMIIWAVMGTLETLRLLGILPTAGYYISTPLWGILWGCSIAPVVLGAYFYVMFFKEDSADTRAGLTKACMLMILSSIVALGISIVQLILGY